jgi:hypothetical protein
MCLIMTYYSDEIGPLQLQDALKATQHASPLPRRRPQKDPTVDSGNVVVEKRPRKKNIPYTPRN